MRSSPTSVASVGVTRDPNPKESLRGRLQSCLYHTLGLLNSFDNVTHVLTARVETPLRKSRIVCQRCGITSESR